MKIDQEKLYNAMANKGVFIRDICRQLNITENELNRMLTGDADICNASRIAYILNVKVDDLAQD